MEAAIQFVKKINGLILNPLILLLMAVALVIFLFGIVEFLSDGGNSEKRSKAQQHMLWGVVGLAVMVSVYGILNIVLATIKTPNPVDFENEEVNLPEHQFDFGLDN